MALMLRLPPTFKLYYNPLNICMYQQLAKQQHVVVQLACYVAGTYPGPVLLGTPTRYCPVLQYYNCKYTFGVA